MSETETRMRWLCEIFDWPDDDESLFAALVILRRARKEDVPSWDDFRYNRARALE